MLDTTMVHMNNNYRYILTVVDLFSKKAWAVPLKTKFADEIVEGLKQVFAANGKTPTILQSDNGGEFANAQIDNFLKEKKVKSIHSLAYKPTSQGAVERFNQTLKHLIYAQFSLYGTKKWTDVLPELLKNYNSSVHSTTNRTPDELHASASKQVRRRTIRRIKAKARMAVKLTQKVHSDLKKGDWVRVHVKGDTSKFKPAYKAQWSKKLYQVVSKSKPANPLMQPTYALKAQNGDKITTRFGRGELLKVPAPDTFTNEQPQRPDFADGTIFNREQHMQRMSEARHQEPAVIPTPRSRPGTRSTVTLPTAGSRYEELVAIDPSADYRQQYPSHRQQSKK